MGVEDGGPGLPVTGWSTTGGDLRVAHFVGLHGLQALPLFGYLLALLAPEWLRMRHRVALVWMAGVSYLCLIGLLTWQALRGQPVISPNARTPSSPSSRSFWPPERRCLRWSCRPGEGGGGDRAA